MENHMHKQIPHKEFYDPFAHYIRGVLFLEEDTFTFTAYRMPYLELDGKTWQTEQAFTNDYHQLIARKYSG